MPPFVSLRGMSRGTEPGYLGIAHRPFTPERAGQRRTCAWPTASPPIGSTIAAACSTRFDDTRRDIDATGTMSGMDAYTETGHRDGHLGHGPQRPRHQARKTRRPSERYKGVEQFLTARRLVEAGVGCVTLSIGGWDTHGQNFQTLKRQLPQVDHGIANLIQDLHDRGMADDVVTVMWGEFGRTPKINSNAGRDHWAPVMSALIAGGGLKMGQAVGASTAKGERPEGPPATPCRRC